MNHIYFMACSVQAAVRDAHCTRCRTQAHALSAQLYLLGHSWASSWCWIVPEIDTVVDTSLSEFNLHSCFLYTSSSGRSPWVVKALSGGWCPAWTLDQVVLVPHADQVNRHPFCLNHCLFLQVKNLKTISTINTTFILLLVVGSYPCGALLLFTEELLWVPLPSREYTREQY